MNAHSQTKGWLNHWRVPRHPRVSVCDPSAPVLSSTSLGFFLDELGKDDRRFFIVYCDCPTATSEEFHRAAAALAENNGIRVSAAASWLWPMVCLVREARDADWRLPYIAPEDFYSC